MNKDERAQILREIDALVDDFRTLRLSNASGHIRTDRQNNLSRSPIQRPSASTLRLLEKVQGRYPVVSMEGEGICLVEQVASILTERENAKAFYFIRTGYPLLDIQGKLIALESGYESWHRLFISGPHTNEVKAAFGRANEWIKRRHQVIKNSLFIDLPVSFGDCCWPDVVLAVAKQGDATMTKPAWKVEIGRVELVAREDGSPKLQASTDRSEWRGVPVEAWKDRENLLKVGFNSRCRLHSEADELFLGVGAEPEIRHSEIELKPFLRDSELALDWLRRWVEGLESPPKGSLSGPGRSADELDDDDREILELRSQGLKPKQIAIKLGRPSEGFSEVVKKLERKVKGQTYLKELSLRAKNGRK